MESVEASTLHRLLGSSASYRAPNFHRDRRVPYDVIIVDEASMMPLSLAAQLVAATADDTRLLIVGDPDQLVSVEAGAVLSDLVKGLATGQAGIPVTTLNRTHRFDSQIGDLAGAVKRGDAAQAIDLLERPTGERITFLKTETDDPPAVLRRSLTQHAVRLHRAAADSEPARALEILNEHRLLCAHREGPAGVAAWNRQIERWLAEHTGQPLWEAIMSAARSW
ncbi:AAA family ATPase [Ornithinimicrobium sp. INDO-MA30-4]|uniref:AAA family ATPase n=1 Tax=Ornithinimicrobium sp. INDO-MA30-4 TaxID=2908651 RepID=UPI0021A27229|nr:AAA family ATPase [Ornithinimicrobium sp. INDO-MA30-4]